ncbi:MAG: hypothetical protein ACLTXH_04430 [Enterobacter hormaechei]
MKYSKMRWFFLAIKRWCGLAKMPKRTLITGQQKKTVLVLVVGKPRCELP